jgi:hypothetical protein
VPTRGMLSAIPSTYFRIGSKFRCIRSTPTEMQSMSENDFECFASTGVKYLRSNGMLPPAAQPKKQHSAVGYERRLA